MPEGQSSASQYFANASRGFIPALLVLLLIGTSLAAFACSETQAADSLDANRLSDLKTCTEVVDNRCLDNRDSFDRSTTKIFTSIKLDNAGSVTATSTLTYLGEPAEELFSYTYKLQSVQSNVASTLYYYFTNAFASEHGWLPGNYEVTIRTDSPGSPTIAKRFTVR